MLDLRFEIGDRFNFGFGNFDFGFIFDSQECLGCPSAERNRYFADRPVTGMPHAMPNLPINLYLAKVRLCNSWH